MGRYGLHWLNLHLRQVDLAVKSKFANHKCHLEGCCRQRSERWQGSKLRQWQWNQINMGEIRKSNKESVLESMDAWDPVGCKENTGGKNEEEWRFVRKLCIFMQLGFKHYTLGSWLKSIC